MKKLMFAATVALSLVASVASATQYSRLALKTAAQAAKTALADPTERATLEAGFAAQNKYTSLFAYTVAQKYVKPTFA